jgi:hypothetical protein
MVAQFLAAMAPRTNPLGIDWLSSIAQSPVVSPDGCATVRIVTGSRSFAAEFTKHAEDRPVEVVAIDEAGLRKKCKSVKAFTKWVDSIHAPNTE